MFVITKPDLVGAWVGSRRIPEEVTLKLGQEKLSS